MPDPVEELRGAVAAEAAALRNGEALDVQRLERPPKAEFGDYSSNVAMMLAPSVGAPPREVAEKLADSLVERLGEDLVRHQVAGPGFLNLFMSDRWYRRTLGWALQAGDEFGRPEPPLSENAQVEFVSANPTGPLTVASGRHAAYGDALSRALEAVGATVEREYYVNDYGTQVQKFGESVRARARGEEPPEDGYQGDYVTDLAKQIDGAAELELDELTARGVELMLEEIRASLEGFRVQMDDFFSERSLHETGAFERTLERLTEHVYESEGAVWLRTTAFGDDKDRVLRRSNGEVTYFASDIAHHAAKLERGFDRVIDVWGADHHGYVGRMKAAWQALGGDPGTFELEIMQLVNLLERGQRTQVSKRAGVIETLDALVEDIGVDAARWFLLQRNHDTTLDLDLTLAREQSQENPVYYVQYAHARIASILRKIGDERVGEALAADLSRGDADLHLSERAMLKKLLEYPGELAFAAERRAPHRMTVYALETAQDFSAFYRDCKVAGAAEEGGDEDFRIALSVQTQRVLAKALGLLGVEAPDEM